MLYMALVFLICMVDYTQEVYVYSLFDQASDTDYIPSVLAPLV